MARRKSKLNPEECKQAIATFFQKQKKFKQIQTRFGEMKAEFYGDMEDYFSCNEIDGKMTVDCGMNIGNVTITRIQSSLNPRSFIMMQITRGITISFERAVK